MNLSPIVSASSALFRRAIGKRLRCARAALDMTQDEMAAHLGIARQTLGSYEKGHSEPLSGLLHKMCVDFNLDANWLLVGDDTRPMFVSQREPLQRSAA